MIVKLTLTYCYHLLQMSSERSTLSERDKQLLDNKKVLVKMCLQLYGKSLEYNCGGKTPCHISITQYDKCLRFVREWELKKKNEEKMEQPTPANTT